MTGEETNTVGEPDSGRTPIRWLAIALALVVSLLIVWQAARYVGLFARVSEWQFHTFGQWLPAFTLLVFVLIPVLAIGLLAKLISLRRKPEAAARPASDLFGQWETKARRFRVMADRIAVALAVCALLTLIAGLIITSGGQPARLIDPDSPGAGRGGQPGELLIRGWIDPQQSATLALDLLFVKRAVRYAPVIEAGDPEMIRYFAELPQDDIDLSAAERATVAFDDEMPGPILALYRNLGYRIAPDVQLIDASRTTMLWPFLVAAVHLVLGALIAFLIARLQNRRIRKANRAASAELGEDDFSVPQPAITSRHAAEGLHAGETPDDPEITADKD